MLRPFGERRTAGREALAAAATQRAQNEAVQGLGTTDDEASEALWAVRPPEPDVARHEQLVDAVNHAAIEYWRMHDAIEAAEADAYGEAAARLPAIERRIDQLRAALTARRDR